MSSHANRLPVYYWPLLAGILAVFIGTLVVARLVLPERGEKQMSTHAHHHHGHD